MRWSPNACRPPSATRRSLRPAPPASRSELEPVERWSAAATSIDPPKTWLLLGDKRGDNAQVEAIAQVLGWPCERRFLQMREPWTVAKPKVEASLHHIDLDRSDPLAPPWPDLVLTIGRRPSMAALWVGERAGGRARLVLVGKPSGMAERFDLVITSAENQMPPLANLLPISLPLMRVDMAAIEAAGRAWEARLGTLPRPLIGFLIGGPTGPFVYDASVVRRLLARAAEVAAAGGTPYLTTSRRTPPAVVAALAEGLPAGARLHRWQPDAEDNPYLGLLGRADGFVVTGDSISMLVEVVRLRRPLAIFELPTSAAGGLDRLRRAFARMVFEPAARVPADSWRRRLALALYDLGLIGYTRDFEAFHAMLFQHGLAVPAGQPLAPPSGEVPDDLGRVVGRIRSLMGAAQAERSTVSATP
jgi:mitochondrial fission protein ELM1